MNTISIVVLAIIAAAFLAACVSAHKRKSVSSCCGDCAKCSRLSCGGKPLGKK